LLLVSAPDTARAAARTLVPAAIQVIQSSVCSSDVLQAISEFFSACCSSSVMSLADCCSMLLLSVPEDCPTSSPIVINTSTVLSVLLSASTVCNSLLVAHLSGPCHARSAVALRVTGSLLASSCPFPEGLAASSSMLLNASSPEPLRPAAAHACGLAAYADAQVLFIAIQFSVYIYMIIHNARVPHHRDCTVDFGSN
jgi:hypothetical protein